MVHLKCPHCGFSNDVEPNMVPDNASRARCPKCSEYFSLKADSASEVAQSLNKTLKFPRNFYVSNDIRKKMYFMVGVVFILTTLLLFLLFFKSLRIDSFHILISVTLVTSQIIGFSLFFWLIRTPLAEITETTFSYCPAYQRGRYNLFKGLMKHLYCVRWEDVTGYEISRSEISTFKGIVVKFDLRSEGPVNNERVFRIATDQLEELTSLIKQLAPQQAFSTEQMQNKIASPTVGEVIFRDWRLTSSGIDSPSGFITWDNVTKISYPPFVIGGFGSISVTHTHSGFAETFTVRAKATDQYQEFVRFMAFNAKEASISPGVMKMLSYPASETRKELMAIALLVSGAILTIATGSTVDYFAEADLMRELYVLLPYTLGLIAGVMTIIALAGRFQGKMVSGNKKVIWALALNLSQPLTILFICAVSSFFFNYLSGSVYETMGHYTEAENRYLAAWDESPKNVCTAFDLGLLYRKQEKHKLAYDYFEKAYKGDPDYWAGSAIALIPDSLAKMGEIKRALQRCDELMKENKNKKRIIGHLSQTKNEILHMKG